MLRLLIVLAIVALAFVVLNFRGGSGAPPERPETTMQHQTDNIHATETMLQDQAASQLERIDAGTTDH